VETHEVQVIHNVATDERIQGGTPEQKKLTAAPDS